MHSNAPALGSHRRTARWAGAGKEGDGFAALPRDDGKLHALSSMTGVRSHALVQAEDCQLVAACCYLQRCSEDLCRWVIAGAVAPPCDEANLPLAAPSTTRRLS